MGDTNIKIEYKEIWHVNLEILNQLGSRGWQPASNLKWEGGGWNKLAQEYEQEGWCGLLMRKTVRSDE